MYASAVVKGKVIRFKLSPVLARAHRENRGKTFTDRGGGGVCGAKAPRTRVAQHQALALSYEQTR